MSKAIYSMQYILHTIVSILKHIALQNTIRLWLSAFNGKDARREKNAQALIEATIKNEL